MPHPLSSGVIAAAVLPYEENGAIDWPTLDRYIRQVAAGGPKAIAMNMAVSEVSCLDVPDQLEVIRRCKASIGGRCLLLSGVNATHTAAAVKLAGQLIEAGAEGLVLFPLLPAFIGAVSVDMVVDYHRAIAEVSTVPLIAFQTVFSKYPKGTITALSAIPSIVASRPSTTSRRRTPRPGRSASSPAATPSFSRRCSWAATAR
jgi:4-hydroxy-tetrahydrodipicolinate synthase